MRDLISDFNSMKAIPNSIPKNAIPTPIPIQMMAIPIQFQFRLDWVTPIPIGSVCSGYPVEGAAALGFRARILRSSSGMK